jgi:uncharacterized membrane protein
MTSRFRTTLMFAAGVVAGLVAGLTAGLPFALLAGWDVAALVFVVSAWWVIAPMNAAQTRHHATRENPGRAAGDVIVLLSSVASLGAVGIVVAQAHADHGTIRDVLAALSVASVALSWLTVHTLFTLRYAQLYHAGPDHGVDFNQDTAPRYADFAYLAFTVGMTFQVSDTDLTTRRIRAAALRHALLSYLFGAVVLASMINLVVGLGTSGG